MAMHLPYKVIILSFTFQLISLSQNIVYGQNINVHNLDSIEHILKNKFDLIAESKSDSIKISLNNSIIKSFDTLLTTYDSYHYIFSELNYVGKIVSPDKTFRIINWNLLFSNGTYQYFGYIQMPDKKNKQIKLHKLIDQSETIENPDQEVLSNENWYGALYYKIIVNKDGNNTIYTLLGWDGNDDFTTKKLIEVLYFTRSGNPKFGKNIFKIDNHRSKRIIFEFSNKAVMTLRYDDYLKMIVYEHLSPEKPSLTGQYKFYIPDFSYDGLEFHKGKYLYYPAINVHDRKQIKRKKLNYFKQRERSNSF